MGSETESWAGGKNMLQRPWLGQLTKTGIETVEEEEYGIDVKFTEVGNWLCLCQRIFLILGNTHWSSI